jgi:hypothetical protein
LADPKSSPIDIIDHIRDLGWQGVMGNTDEMLAQPSSLEDFASQSSSPPAMWTAIREIATATRATVARVVPIGDRQLGNANLPELTENAGYRSLPKIVN